MTTIPHDEKQFTNIVGMASQRHKSTRVQEVNKYEY